jgi:DNA helicase-2/ATP-dependent DNA helicase PcrA
MEQEVFPYRGITSGEAEELDEERRLAYVALTRARRRLTITYAGMRTLFGQTRYLERSQFLDDLPKDAIKLEGATRSASRPTSYGGSSYGGSSYGGSSYGGSRSSGNSYSGSRSSGNTRFAGQRYTGSHGSPERPPLAPGTRVVERDEYSQAGGDEAAGALRPGAHVRHVRFGEGVVQSVESGIKPSVVARFPGFGEKKILLEFLEIA